MLSGKRTAAVLGVLLLAALGLVFTSSSAAHKGEGPQQTATPTPPQYQPPTIRLDADTQVVTLCPNAESMANPRVRLKAEAFSPEGKPLRYKWQVTGGSLDRDDAPEVVWDLSGARPQVYEARVVVESGPVNDPLCRAFTSTKVYVRNCPESKPFCPNVSIYCPDVQRVGAPITFTASVSGGTSDITPGYNWVVSEGRIISGQNTPTITVDTAGVAGRPITATVEVTGYGESLDCRAQCQAAVPAPPDSTKFGEIGEVPRDEEKAQLDVFVIELQNSPSAQGYIIAYGGSGRRSATGQQRAQRARDYVVTTRGIDPSRIVTLDGGQRTTGSLHLWLVPPGATPPRP
jgi:hypothetical protein